MHKFRTILSVVATAAMVLGTMGSATASAASVTNETRADFVAQLDQSLGIQPVFPTSPTFSDVPTTNADYGYIEAASQKGFINGISAGFFGPSLPITRAEAAKILVEAYEGGNYTPTQTSTTFTDNTSIPTALVGYVAEAATLNLMKGFTSGAFGPEAYLTTAQEVHLVAQLNAALAANGFKVAASATDVAAGEIVTLTSTAVGATTYSVTSSNASSALISGNSFVASAPGTYTVTGKSAGMSATVTISVYGTAANVTLSAKSASVVADAGATDTLTADIVDANGALVANDSSDTVTVTGTGHGQDANNGYAGYITTSNGAWLEGGTVNTSTNTETFTAKNGVATITLLAPSAAAAGNSDNIQVNFVDASGSTHIATTAIAYTAPTATAFKLAPSSTLIAAGTTTNVPVEVLDQLGNVMTTGLYTVTATVTGSAYFPGNVQSEQFTFAGNSGSLNVTVPGFAGSGTVNLSVSGSQVGGSTLTAAASALTIGTAGTATQLAVSANSNANFVNGTLTADTGKTAAETFAGTVEDANGLQTTSGAPSSVTWALTQSGSTVDSNTTAVTNGAFTVTVPAGDLVSAGSYTLTVSANGLTAGTSAITVVPGAANQLGISPSTSPTEVLAANPTTTVTATVEDGEGNTVASAGTVITFAVAVGSTAGTTINGSTSSVNVATGSNGAASVTLAIPTGVGNSASVTATSGAMTKTTATVKEVGVAVSSVGVSAGASSYTANVAAGSSSTPMFTIKATDAYGDLASGDIIQITVPQNLFGGANITSDIYGGAVSAVSGSGYLEYDVTAAGNAITIYGALPSVVGSYTVTAEDLSAPTQPQGSASTVVTAGTAAAINLFDNAGTDVSTSSTGDTLASGANAQFTLKPVDGAGNPVTSDVDYVVTLPALTSATGAVWRTNLSQGDVTSVTVPAYATGVTVYLVNNTSGNITINNAAQSATNLDAAYAKGSASTQLEVATSATTVALSATGYSAGTLTTTGGTTTFTVTVSNSAGGVANQPVYLYGVASGGTLSATEVYTNASGIAYFTYTTPSVWASGSTDSFKVSVGGGSAGGTGLPSQTAAVSVAY